MKLGDRMSILYALKSRGQATTHQLGLDTGFDLTTLNIELNACIERGYVEKVHLTPDIHFGGRDRLAWRLDPDFAENWVELG